MKTKPSFFIVGAPKCGTTALFDYLGQHPSISLPSIKEPNFFNSDLQGSKKAKNIEDYLRLFEGCDSNTITGEATTWYLFSKEAAKNIHEFNPNAKIIIMLRNPVDMLYSLHSHYMYHGNIETITDFRKALEAERERKQGRNLPKNSTRPYGVFYSELVDFAPQIDRYYKKFGKDNVMVILFEDFIKDTNSIYGKVLDFLSVPKGFTPVIKKVNANKRVKNKMIHSLILFLKHNSFFSFLTKELRLGFGFMRKIREMNREDSERKKMDLNFRNELISKYLNKIKNLEKLLNRDLSKWYYQAD